MTQTKENKVGDHWEGGSQYDKGVQGGGKRKLSRQFKIKGHTNFQHTQPKHTQKLRQSTLTIGTHAAEHGNTTLVKPPLCPFDHCQLRETSQMQSVAPEEQSLCPRF